MSEHLAVKLLSSYLDAEVTPSELRLVEGHLEDCSECRRTVAGLRSVVEGVRRLEAVAPPESLAASVERRVARVSLDESRGFRVEESLRRWVAQPVLAPVFAIVLALGAILYLFAFGVARDEARGTRLVIASAPSEADSAEAITAEEVLPETVLDQELPNRLEPPASVRADQPAPARSPVARGRLSAAARPADRGESAESAESGTPTESVEERLAAKRVAAKRTPESAAGVQRIESHADAVLGEAVALREVAGRRFVADGATWVEVGLKDEIVDEVVDWRQGPDGRFSELEDLRELGRVRVRIGDRIVEVIYPEGTPPN